MVVARLEAWVSDGARFGQCRAPDGWLGSWQTALRPSSVAWRSRARVLSLPKVRATSDQQNGEASN